MNARTKGPTMTPGLASVLAALALFFPTSAARAAAILWRADALPRPFIGLWITPALFLCAMPPFDELPAAARILASMGYTLADPPPEPLRATVAALGYDAVPTQHDAEALAVFLDSLPAIITHAAFSDEPRRAVDATHLRAILHAVTGPVQVTRTVYRAGATNAAALMFSTPTWRAILRTVDAETLLTKAPTFNAAQTVALSCARCGTTAARRFATEADARDEALRRRWSRHETDEGDVFACANCTRVLARMPGAVV